MRTGGEVGCDGSFSPWMASVFLCLCSQLTTRGRKLLPTHRLSLATLVTPVAWSVATINTTIARSEFASCRTRRVRAKIVSTRPSALLYCFAEAHPAEDRRFFQALLLLLPVSGVLPLPTCDLDKYRPQVFYCRWAPIARMRSLSCISNENPMAAL